MNKQKEEKEGKMVEGRGKEGMPSEWQMKCSEDGAVPRKKSR
jgi:hypothetical protein